MKKNLVMWMTAFVVMLALALDIGAVAINESAGQTILGGPVAPGAVFTENQGQWDDEVKFRVDVGGASVWLTGDGLLFHFVHHEGETRAARPAGMVGDLNADTSPAPEQSEFLNVLARLKGANQNPPVRLEEPLDFKTHYYIGAHQSDWHTNVASYREVVFEDVYEGIDVRYYVRNGKIEYDFIVHPGADPSLIEIEYNGIEALSVNDEGQIEIQTEWGKLVEERPVSFQSDGVNPVQVASGYLQKSDRSFGFTIDKSYNRQTSLTIDPVIMFSTYLSGTDFDCANDVAVDDDGDIYAAGSTYGLYSNYWPDYLYHGSSTNSVAFVLKMTPDGVPVYLAYVGGTGSDVAYGVDVDITGQAYFTGSSSSADYPCQNAFMSSRGSGTYAVVVTALGADGDSLIYSTYIAGNANDFGYAIAVDQYGEAVVTGSVQSDDFPTINPLIPAAPGSASAFVTKFTDQGSSLVFSTYLGGTNVDEGTGIAVDENGNAYVAGWTFSGTFPVVNALQPTMPGPGDAFVAKIDSSGSNLLFSTFFGGSASDHAQDVCLDNSGRICLAGFTESNDFPLVNPYQSSHGGVGLNWDGFVSILSNDGASVIYSTYLGGISSDYANSIGVDASGAVYVTGRTASSDFPIVENWMPISDAGEYIYVSSIDASGITLDYSSLMGKGKGLGIAVTASGDAAVCGSTTRGGLTTFNAQQHYAVWGDDYQPTIDGFLLNIGGPEHADDDGDWVDDAYDLCPGVYSPLNKDWDNDGIGDSCDVCPRDSLANIDGDDVEVCIDNCPEDYNPDQIDSDGDGVGDVCDHCPGFADVPDTDNDGIPDGCDECTDTDGDGYGDPGFAANICPEDNCPGTFNTDQLDLDGDGLGDACDNDQDGDGIPEGHYVTVCYGELCWDMWVYCPCGDYEACLGYWPPSPCDDNCPRTYNPDQRDSNLDGVGDACCCFGTTGDIYGYGGVCDIGDLTALIGYLFIPPYDFPDCPAEANIDGEGEVDIGDVTALINYLFVPPFPEPAPCQ